MVVLGAEARLRGPADPVLALEGVAPDAARDTGTLGDRAAPRANRRAKISVVRPAGFICCPKVGAVHARHRPVGLRVASLPGAVEGAHLHNRAVGQINIVGVVFQVVVGRKHATLRGERREHLVGALFRPVEGRHVARVAHVLHRAVHGARAADAVLRGARLRKRLAAVPHVVRDGAHDPAVAAGAALVVVLVVRLDRKAVHHARGRERERDPAHRRARRARWRRLHLVRREGRPAHLLGLEEVGRRDHLLALARAARDAALPAQHGLGRGARVLLVLHLDVVVVRAAQADRGRKRRRRQVVVRLPAVDDEAVVDPQLDALVGLGDAGLEGEHLGGRVRRVVKELEQARPAHRKALLVRERQVAKAARNVVAKAALRVRHVKVDRLLDPRRDGLRELHVVVVGRVETGALRQARVHLVVALDRGRVRDLVAPAQRKEARRGDNRRRVVGFGRGGSGVRADRRRACRRRQRLGPENGVPRGRVGQHRPVGIHRELQRRARVVCRVAALPAAGAACDHNEHVVVHAVVVVARERLAAPVVVRLVRVRVRVALRVELVMEAGPPHGPRPRRRVTERALRRLQDGLAVKARADREGAQRPHRLQRHHVFGANLGQVVHRRRVRLRAPEVLAGPDDRPRRLHCNRHVVAIVVGLFHLAPLARARARDDLDVVVRVVVAGGVGVVRQDERAARRHGARRRRAARRTAGDRGSRRSEIIRRDCGHLHVPHACRGPHLDPQVEAGCARNAAKQRGRVKYWNGGVIVSDVLLHLCRVAPALRHARKLGAVGVAVGDEVVARRNRKRGLLCLALDRGRGISDTRDGLVELHTVHVDAVLARGVGHRRPGRRDGRRLRISYCAVAVERGAHARVG